jgi:hypothetical protein
MLLLVTTALAAPDTADPSPPLPLVEASAGDDFMAYVGQTVELNGTGFGDGDLEYGWTRVSGPPAELSDPAAANPQFTPNEPGTYTFDLVVSSGGESSLPDAVSVAIIRTDAGTVHTGGRCATTGPVAGGALMVLGLLALGRRQTAS